MRAWLWPPLGSPRAQRGRGWLPSPPCRSPRQPLDLRSPGWASDLPPGRLARGPFHLHRLRRGADQDQGALRARHAAFDEDEVPLRIDADHLVRAGGDALVAHLTGHLQALENACRVGGADGARLADVHRAVRLGPAAELVPLDEALEALALRRGGDIDELAGGEDLRLELLAGLEAFVAPDLDDVAVRLDVCLLELPVGWLGELFLVRHLERNAGGRVAVFLGGAQAQDPAGAGLEHGHR